MATSYTEYNGFKYSPAGTGKWQVTLPSKLRSVVDAENEDALKAKIDEIIAAMTAPEG